MKKITHFLLEDEGPTLRQRTDKTKITKKKLKISPPPIRSLWVEPFPNTACVDGNF